MSSAAPAKPDELLYFSVQARQQGYTLTLAAGNVKQNTKYVDLPYWMGGGKAAAKFGSIPVINNAGGRGIQIAQTAAVERYAARVAGLYPTDIYDQAHVDEIWEQLQDIENGFYKSKFSGGSNWQPDGTFKAGDAKVQAEAFENHVKSAEAMLAPLEKMLAASKSGFFLDQPSYVDVKLYTIFLHLAQCGHGAPKGVFAEHARKVETLGYLKEQALKEAKSLLAPLKAGDHEGM